MTVEQAIQSLKDNNDKLPGILPSKLYEQTPEETAVALRSGYVKKSRYVAAQESAELNVEDYQNRANEEWEELIAKEDDPLQAAALVLNWFQDKTQAFTRMEGDVEVLESGEWLAG